MNPYCRAGLGFEPRCRQRSLHSHTSHPLGVYGRRAGGRAHEANKSMGSVQCAIYIPNCNARTNSRGKSPHAIPALTGMRYYRYRCSAHMRTRLSLSTSLARSRMPPPYHLPFSFCRDVLPCFSFPFSSLDSCESVLHVLLFCVNYVMYFFPLRACACARRQCR